MLAGSLAAAAGGAAPPAPGSSGESSAAAVESAPSPVATPPHVRHPCSFSSGPWHLTSILMQAQGAGVWCGIATHGPITTVVPHRPHYACQECDTHTSLVQLVVSTKGDPVAAHKRAQNMPVNFPSQHTLAALYSGLQCEYQGSMTSPDAPRQSPALAPFEPAAALALGPAPLPLDTPSPSASPSGCDAGLGLEVANPA